MGKIIFCVVWTLLGGLVLCYLEGWHVLTAVYFLVQVLTTVGYGDVVVYSQHGRLFLSFYVLGTVLVLGTIVIELVDIMSSRNTKRLQEFIENRTRGVRMQENRTRGVGMQETNPVLLMFKLKSHQVDLFASFLKVFALCVVGTVFFALYESCSCSYGVTRVSGCEDGPTCAATGGNVKTWVDAWYMALVTLTTVGFGDQSPHSQIGRAFGMVWMTFGVVAMAHFASRFGEVFLHNQKNQRRLEVSSPSLFKQIDRNGSGALDRDEFLRYALVKFQLLSRTDVDGIDKLFDEINTKEKQELSYDDIKEYCDHE